ncbi:hypothetical protein G5B37_08595 [Rasiella rasia]|uniref:Uncharacterized protein n=1 Tax=Rasiella rasia TaxID=2744027 RepID=A0A6G6GM35_9FLAO|nr:hypothetical protein [Rasiella rasia]QIE59619.1 hypothetical protein G5B37_08595 [Rasiella rasia]
MKKLIALLTIMLVLVACKSENKEGQENTSDTSETTVVTEENANQFRGEFIYINDGAVLKGNSFIYGVAINDMAEELKKRVAPVKKDTYDMVPVIVKGTLANKEAGAEGWDEILTITEIVDVSKTPAEADIKIEDKKN